MDKNDLKLKLNRSFDELSEDIELKAIDRKELPPLSEEELEDLVKNHGNRSKVRYGSYRLLAMAAPLILLITGFLIYYGRVSAYSRIIISGTPALTIYMKESRVVGMKAGDRDSESYIEGIDTDQPISDVLDDLFLRMEEKDCFRADKNLDITVKGPEKEEIEEQVSVKVETLIEKDASVSVAINHKIVRSHKQEEKEEKDQETENAEIIAESEFNQAEDKEKSDRTSEKKSRDQEENDNEDLDEETESQSQSPESATLYDEDMSSSDAMDPDQNVAFSPEDEMHKIVSQEIPSHEDDTQAIEKESATDSSEDGSETQSSQKKKKKKNKKKKRKSRKKKGKKKKSTRKKKGSKDKNKNKQAEDTKKTEENSIPVDSSVENSIDQNNEAD